MVIITNDDDTKCNYNRLVFTGGGMLGLCYMGVIERLVETDQLYNFKSFWGTSTGALFAYVAILQIVYGERKNKRLLFRMKRIILDTQFDDLFNFRLENVLYYGGLDDGKLWEKWFRFVVQQVKVDAVNLSFRDLPEGLDFGVFVFDCNDMKVKALGRNCHPDMKIITALRYSMAIPFLFTIDKYRFLDGHIGGQVPSALHELNPQERKETVIYTLQLINEEQPSSPSSENVEGQFSSVFQIFLFIITTLITFFNRQRTLSQQLLIDGTEAMVNSIKVDCKKFYQNGGIFCKNSRRKKGSNLRKAFLGLQFDMTRDVKLWLLNYENEVDE